MDIPEVKRVSAVKRDHLARLAKEGKRPDGRGPDEYRPIKIERNVIKKAEGSARVKIGNTMVLAGIKLEVGEPYPDSPEEGAMSTSAELPPLASPEFEPGPPSGEAIEVARVVDRGIRESNAIDLSKLCIKEGEKVWLIYVDIYVLNHDGNLIDASALAALGALLNARFPKVEDEKIVYGELTNEKLPIRKLPICCTFAKIGNRFLIDPCLREEVAMDVGLSVTTTSGGKVNALQKLGKNTGLREDEISKCVEMAIRKGRELRQLFKKV